MSRKRNNKVKHGRGASPDHSYMMPAQLCLHCGYVLDAATEITGSSRPKKGDFTVCLNCGALHQFGDRMCLMPTSIHVARDKLEPERFQRVMKAQILIQLRGRIDEKGTRQ